MRPPPIKCSILDVLPLLNECSASVVVLFPRAIDVLLRDGLFSFVYSNLTFLLAPITAVFLFFISWFPLAPFTSPSPISDPLIMISRWCLGPGGSSSPMNIQPRITLARRRRTLTCILLSLHLDRPPLPLPYYDCIFLFLPLPLHLHSLPLVFDPLHNHLFALCPTFFPSSVSSVVASLFFLAPGQSRTRM